MLMRGQALEWEKLLISRVLYMAEPDELHVFPMTPIRLWQVECLLLWETDPVMTAESARGVKRTTPVFALRHRFPLVKLRDTADVPVHGLVRT